MPRIAERSGLSEWLLSVREVTRRFSRGLRPDDSMSKTILHADDSASVRRWVAEQLSDMDLKVISVADGEAALHVLRESPCDLLLTDLEMPNLDGLALVAAVRDLPMHRFLPVWFCLAGNPANSRRNTGRASRDGSSSRSNRKSCDDGSDGSCHVES